EDTALWLHVFAGQEHRRQTQRATVVVGRRPIVVSPVGLLSSTPGISIEQAKALVARFGSIAAIAAASEAQLQELPGIGPMRARALLRVLTTAAPDEARRLGGPT